MSYVNIYEVLPKEIIQQIQTYVDGVNLYIPRKEENRKSWGDSTGVKRLYYTRNQEIKREYQHGISISELAEKYYLTEKTIQKILYEKK